MFKVLDMESEGGAGRGGERDRRGGSTQTNEKLGSPSPQHCGQHVFLTCRDKVFDKLLRRRATNENTSWGFRMDFLKIVNRTRCLKLRYLYV